MKRWNTFSLSAILMATLLLPFGARAQEKPIKDQLVGAWTFVSAFDYYPDGRKDDRWGANPKGVFIFDITGHFAFFISRSDLPKIAGNSPFKATGEESQAVMRGLGASFGSYSINEAEKVLITRVEGGIFPNQIGATQRRVIVSLTADQLKYANEATTTGVRAESIWKRAK
jgi:lipocalin-like protein